MKAIPIVSIKGGTGKTLVSCSLAQELNSRGEDVALIDADLDSSNVGEVMDIEDKEHELTDDRKFIPMDKDGLEIFSMSGMLDQLTDSVSKSGTEKSQIIEDAVLNTEWGVPKDSYFIIDMNAGSSDIWKAVRRLFGDNLMGTIIVTTPKTVIDAERTYDLCSKYRVRILGVIENMGKFTCPNCDEEYFPFGKDEGREFAEDRNLDFFGTIPILVDSKEEMKDEVISEVADKVVSYEG